MLPGRIASAQRTLDTSSEKEKSTSAQREIYFHKQKVVARDLTKVDWATIPAPKDDGAAAHLVGQKISVGVCLKATNNEMVDLSLLKGKTVVYAYPRTGRPDMPSLDGWDMIPGAKGCTPQSCAFRDHFAQLRAVGVTNVFGLSTQDTTYQQEAAERLHLPFRLLSDEAFQLTDTLKLPTFEASGIKLLKRCTLIIQDGEIKHVFYPVFPPDRNATDVIKWFRQTNSK